MRYFHAPGSVGEKRTRRVCPPSQNARIRYVVASGERNSIFRSSSLYGDTFCGSSPFCQSNVSSQGSNVRAPSEQEGRPAALAARLERNTPRASSEQPITPI